MSAYRPFDVRLARREVRSPSYLRITLSGNDLRECGDVVLDQRVKLLLGGDLDAVLGQDEWFAALRALPAQQQPSLRTFTLAAVRREVGEVDIDVVLHEPCEGPAASFAATEPIGTRAGLVAPVRGAEGADEIGVAWRPGAAREVWVVADETAVPAAANIATALTPGHAATLVLEVPRADDIRPLDAPSGTTVRWCARDRGESALDHLPFPCGPVQAFTAEEALWDETSGEGRYLWVAGEMSWVATIRRSARAAGIDRQGSSFMGYWRRGGTIS
ncbi:siderophore-interacting protein [Calidifontibacter sp. DB0510]|uniref:Siderophore-interacting protein n=1 Tax=Metallococcus carri TaxID=1656884 RepID=A0A967B0M1_9MICO|nr:siderophore-interacting protein [Metallococcus carri]NHN56601.1 siderophore-interacting protein [Metallococcus carri]NOP38900.1 siderophore-interacting protein [Calidifontibacter sp. DB2511S]